MNYRWPAKHGNGRVPWYVLAWRCLWLLPFATSLALFCFCLLMVDGWRSATQQFKEYL